MSTKPTPKFEEVAGDYRALFTSCTLKQGPKPSSQAARQKLASFMVGRIVNCRERYEAVAIRFANQLPWWAVALIHAMEASLSFECHLHNGDSLKRRTVNEPAGRPVGGTPPFNWLESAVDALRYDRFHLVPASRWADVAGVLFQLESFNGWGSRLYHGVPTAYLWAGTNHERPGKYVADGVWQASAISEQLGAALLLKELTTSGAAVFRGWPVKPLAVAA